MCAVGKVYSECGSACPKKCNPESGLSQDLCNRAVCVEGCFCPKGSYEHGGYSTRHVSQRNKAKEKWPPGSIFN